MAFDYSKADCFAVSSGSEYFIDANIWIKILQPSLNPKHKEKKYRLLFESIVSNKSSKIILSSLVLSEVINRILREVYMKKYILKIKAADPSFVVTPEFYKNTFRPTVDFNTAYSIICDEIKNYHSSLKLINDGFGTNIHFNNILSNPPASLDFNDFYYYNLCKEHGFILITDDKDFWVEDIKIVTMSESLYNKYINHLLSLGSSKRGIRIN